MYLVCSQVTSVTIKKPNKHTEKESITKQLTSRQKVLPAIQVAEIHEVEGLWHPCKNLPQGSGFSPPILIPASLYHPTCMISFQVQI